MPANGLYAVYGASGFGREVVPLARRMLAGTLAAASWELVIVDDHPPASTINGHRVLTYDAFVAEPAARKYISIAIADSSIRRALADRCVADGVEFFSVIADNALILDDVSIGEGAIITGFTTCTSNVRIGRHCHLNIYSYVAHDCVVGDFVTFAPSVKCNGNVVVEDDAYLGTGAMIRQGRPSAPTTIGRGAVVGMGAVVTKSVPPGITVVGNPARPLER